MIGSLSLLSSTAVGHFISGLPWYLTRASGIVAALLLVLLIITGIGSYTGYQFRFMAPLKAWANHRAIGIALAASVTVHIVTLLFDKFISFNPAQLLVPFLSTYKQTSIAGVPVGSLGVALGVVSLYLIAAIVITSLTRVISARTKFWKGTHYLSYIVVLFVFFHSLMLGTDLKSGVWRIIWIALNIIVLGFIGLRLRRAGALRN